MNRTYTTDQVEEAIRKGTKAAQDSFDQFSRMTRDQMQQHFPNVMRGYDEAAASYKDGLDAVAQSTALTAKGVEQILNACFAYGQEAWENNMSAAKAMMNCRNLKEMADLQSQVAQSNMDRFITGSSRISEMSVKAANQAVQPLQKRMNDAMDGTPSKRRKAA